MKLILSKIKTYFGKLDKLLLFMCMGIACFAVFIQYTLYENDISSAVTASQYKTQIIAFIAGIVIAMALAAINYKYLAKLWFIYVPLAMGLTLLLFTPLGIQREGADDIGWLDLGIMTIQPSEILKLAFILSLAVHLSKVEDRMNEPIHFILLCIHGAIPTLLIRQTGDDGSALVFLFIFICMMFAAGLSWKYILGAVSAAAVAMATAFAFFSDKIGKGYQWYRILAVIDPENTTGWAPNETTWKNIIYQQQRGEIAIGSGGIFGNGFFGGRYYSVPNAHNDFIFSWIGNAAGFVGCCVVLGVLLAIIIKTFATGACSEDMLGSFICAGIGGAFMAQIFVNVGMNLRLLPVIGVTLPFYSAGGSSVLMLYICVGLVLSVYMHNTKKLFG